MTTFYNRVKDNVCPAVLQSEIENDVTITTVIEYIRVDDEINLSFAFAASLPMQEETQLDVLLAAHVCERTDESEDNGQDSSGESISLTNTPTGRLFQMTFHEKGDVCDKWLRVGEGASSNYTNGMIPWGCKLIAMSFSNEKNTVDSFIEIHKATLDSGDSNVLDYSWDVTGVRAGVQKDFGGDLTYNVGDRVAVYLNCTDMSSAKKPLVVLYFAITDESNVIETVTEAYSGKF